MKFLDLMFNPFEYIFLLGTFIFHVVVGQGKCPTGFSHYYIYGHPLQPYVYQPSCYKFVIDFDKADTWMGAWRRCKALGANLVSIETDGEQLHLYKVIHNHSDYKNPPTFNVISFLGYWTSGTNECTGLKPGCTWKWAGTAKKVNYTQWDKGQPDNFGPFGEHCIQLASWADFRWNDFRCYYSFLPHICEKNAEG